MDDESTCGNRACDQEPPEPEPDDDDCSTDDEIADLSRIDPREPFGGQS